jgi:predicted ester cyclase
MTPEEMEALGERIGQAWNGGKPELLDEVYGPGFINRSNGQDCEVTKKVLIRYREAFPDLHLTADDIIMAGDKIVSRGTAHATHTGAYLGIPATGKRFERAYMNIFRVENGKIVEEWSLGDDLGVLHQLGVLK